MWTTFLFIFLAGELPRLFVNKEERFYDVSREELRRPCIFCLFFVFGPGPASKAFVWPKIEQ